MRALLSFLSLSQFAIRCRVPWKCTPSISQGVCYLHQPQHHAVSLLDEVNRSDGAHLCGHIQDGDHICASTFLLSSASWPHATLTSNVPFQGVLALLSNASFPFAPTFLFCTQYSRNPCL